jgi:membrane protease YdiL (CAAX protease family)
MIKGLYNRIFSSTWALTEEESLAYRVSTEGKNADWKTMVIAVWACAALVLIEYVGKDPGYVYIIDLFKGLGLDSLSKHLAWYLEKNPLRQLNSLAYWAVVIAVCYLIVPVLIIRFIFKEKVSDYGIRKGLLGKDYKLYLGMLCVMIPMVYFFSRTDGFQLRYPFYRMAKGEGLYPNFLIWQVLYLFQFFCLEFFFRGFLVHGLKKRFGYYSVFIMTIPYCMIHFGKPMPETFAAIIAGIILGTLSLKSGTIWMGVLIHYSVAISMDLSALWQKGFWN